MAEGWLALEAAAQPLRFSILRGPFHVGVSCQGPISLQLFSSFSFTFQILFCSSLISRNDVPARAFSILSVISPRLLKRLLRNFSFFLALTTSTISTSLFQIFSTDYSMSFLVLLSFGAGSGSELCTCMQLWAAAASYAAASYAAASYAAS